ncbi:MULTISPECIES: hypothetical protein [Rhodanobacter]|uniref:hypothetical protein n=1 Tax=Rhodanobacter TaxID=75309 RepID=UPI001201E9A2|nr:MULTISPECIES: hypothetical protein [Rhodanobacter]TAN14485.1 MAG: hypothetical protein EPN35_15790 [Rhodanobacter sp.]UJJ56109.1 hypothetical protein LRK53_06975 [Rhodanobacter thiooxydans]
MKLSKHIIIFLVSILAGNAAVARDVAQADKFLLSVNRLASTNNFSTDMVKSYFCLTMVRGESGRIGYVRYRGMGSGCGLPIRAFEVDIPSVSANDDIFVKISLSNKVCLVPKIFEDTFPGGTSSLMPDAGIPYYSAKIGLNTASASYQSFLNGKYCIYEINLKIKQSAK